MASAAILERQSAAREELARRIEQVSDPEFIRTRIFECLPEYRSQGRSPEPCRPSVVQNDGTGAATVEYRFDGTSKAFAKLYTDDSGRHAFDVLQALWSNGLGADSRYRVSEPLGFFPEHNLVLIRSAKGKAVAEAGTEAELAAGAREAARWLIHLHGSAIRAGEQRYPWEVFHKLMHRIAKAAAHHPDRVEQLIEMSDRLEQLARRIRLQFVQAHGQYRHIHVFVSEESVTVIDLDRSRPSDPAQDVGEFIHRMRTKWFKASSASSRPELATAVFLEEYRGTLPENLVNLPFYWGCHALVSLWRFMKSSAPSKPNWEIMTDFYLREFEEAISCRHLV